MARSIECVLSSDDPWDYSRSVTSMAGNFLPLGSPLPFPDIMAIIAVALEVGGPLMLIFGIQTRWVALLMIAFVIMATLTTHRYWEFADAARRMQATNFYK